VNRSDAGDDVALITALETIPGVNDSRPLHMAERVSFVVARPHDT
jgi:hypothetical protein